VNFCVDAACVLEVENPTASATFEILGNPVSSLSALSYRFANRPTRAELFIYNSTGMLVNSQSIVNAQGLILLDGNNYSNGVYLCKLTENGRTVGIQRMVVSK
jgi:hypothetical protein